MQNLNLPVHILVVPDGNGRWAEKHGKYRYEGHIEGAKRFREISTAAFRMKIRYFTFWAASKDNLEKRGHAEALNLTLIFRQELERSDTLPNLLKNKIRLEVLGEWLEIVHDRDLLRLIQSLRGQTKIFNRHFLTILFGYSGVDEMIEAMKWICRHHPKHISEETIRRALWVHNQPPVDLVIRTGAERHNWTHNSSGLLNPWLTPNSQIYSPTTLWPDFTAEMFRQTVADYSKIPRRFGA